MTPGFDEVFRRLKEQRNGVKMQPGDGEYVVCKDGIVIVEMEERIEDDEESPRYGELLNHLNVRVFLGEPIDMRDIELDMLEKDEVDSTPG